MLTKNQIKIMEVFAANITKRFSIRKIAKLISVDYSHVYRSIQPLINYNLLSEDEEQYLSLNYKKHHQELAYIESVRSQAFLAKASNKTVGLFDQDALNTLKDDFFVLLIFGSAVTKQKHGDVDILLVVDHKDKVDNREKVLYNIASQYSVKFDINVISFESVYEMLASRDQLNVLNETLNNHIILHGAESFYRMLKIARR